MENTGNHLVKNGDLIDSLPTNATELPNADVQVLNSLFKQNSSDFMKILKEFREAATIAILITLFSSTYFDSLVHRLLPITATSPVLLLVIKTLLVMVIVWFLKNLFV